MPSGVRIPKRSKWEKHIIFGGISIFILVCALIFTGVLK